MKIRYVEASILDATEPYILHGCNAQGAMGSGVAKVLYERYPNVRTEYLRQHAAYKRAGKEFLGTIHYCDNNPHIVINGITQEFYGRDGKLYASYDAIRTVIENVNFHAELIAGSEELPPMSAIALPLLGCGLAGGDWNIVSQIIEDGSTNFEPVIYVPEGRP